MEGKREEIGKVWGEKLDFLSFFWNKHTPHPTTKPLNIIYVLNDIQLLIFAMPSSLVALKLNQLYYFNNKIGSDQQKKHEKREDKQH